MNLTTWILCLSLVMIHAVAASPSVKMANFGPGGRRSFVLNGSLWTARGHNYIRLSGSQGEPPDLLPVFHSTFNVGLYNPTEAEAALTKMGVKGFGYNWVRVFIDEGSTSRSSGINGNGSAPLNEAYIENLADFLRRAGRHRLQVQVQINSIFPQNTYWTTMAGTPPAWAAGMNIIFLAPTFVSTFRQYVALLAQSLNRALQGDTSPILSISLMNEAAMDVSQLPFSSRAIHITTADGVVYDMSNPTDRQQCVDANYVYFANTAAAAIRSKVPSLLVTMGMFTFAAVGKMNGPNGVEPCGAVCDNRYPPYPPSLAQWSTLDYLDLHIYPTGPTWNSPNVKALFADLDSSGVATVDTTKMTILVGEFGSFKMWVTSADNAAHLMASIQQESCASKRYFFVGGFGLWTWDTWEQSGFIWNAMDDNGAVAYWLSPLRKPVICA